MHLHISTSLNLKKSVGSKPIALDLTLLLTLSGAKQHLFLYHFRFIMLVLSVTASLTLLTIQIEMKLFRHAASPIWVCDLLYRLHNFQLPVRDSG